MSALTRSRRSLQSEKRRRRNPVRSQTSAYCSRSRRLRIVSRITRRSVRLATIERSWTLEITGSPPERAHHDGEGYLEEVVDRPERGYRRAARRPGRHGDRHFDQPKPGAVQAEENLGLGIVRRIVVGEEADHLASRAAEARRGIAQAHADKERDEPREPRDAEAPRRRRTVSRRAEESRSDRQIGAP